VNLRAKKKEIGDKKDDAAMQGQDAAYVDVLLLQTGKLGARNNCVGVLCVSGT
jgi:hypothetical protein